METGIEKTIATINRINHAKRIFEELETSLCYKLINGKIYLIIRETDYKHYKKEFTGE